MAEKTVQIRRVGDAYKAAPDNYNRTKSAFGSYSFPAAELDAKLAAAKSKGFEVQIAEHAGRAVCTNEPVAPDRIPAGQVDEVLGILKTQTTEYVRDCVTTRLVPKERARFIGLSRGFPYWITQGDDIAGVNIIYPSVFGDKRPADNPRKLSLRMESPNKKRRSS